MSVIVANLSNVPLTRVPGGPIDIGNAGVGFATLFSATFPSAVQALAAALLREPLRINVAAGPGAGVPDIEQRAVEVDAARRTPLQTL